MPNAEYPDLPFVPPRSFGRGRPAPPRVIVIHYTAGSERSTSAEDGASYDQRRTDGTSCHYFVDSNSVVQCVYTWDRANSAFYNGNRIGIQYELCGTQQTRAQWLDPDSDATLTNAARQAARDAAKYGIPVRHLTPAQCRAGESGIVGHDTITLAYPEDNGDHMDPGTGFPWDVLLARINQFLNGEDDMGIESTGHGQVVMGRVEALTMGYDTVRYGPTAGTEPVWLVRAIKALGIAVGQVDEAVAAQLAAEFAALDQAVAAARTELGQVDEAVIAALPGQSDAELAQMLEGLLGAERLQHIAQLAAQG